MPPFFLSDFNIPMSKENSQPIRINSLKNEKVATVKYRLTKTLLSLIENQYTFY